MDDRQWEVITHRERAVMTEVRLEDCRCFSSLKASYSVVSAVPCLVLSTSRAVEQAGGQIVFSNNTQCWF